MNFISFHDNRSLPPPAQHRCVFLWHAAFPAVQRIDGESQHSRMDRHRILYPMLPGICPNPPGKVAHYLFGICSGVQASLLAAVTQSRVYWWVRRSFFNQSDEVTLAFMHTNSSVTFGGYCGFLIASMMVLESWLCWPWFHVPGIGCRVSLLHACRTTMRMGEATQIYSLPFTVISPGGFPWTVDSHNTAFPMLMPGLCGRY